MSILEIRQDLGLSQADFAKKFHLNVRTVQSWEQGWRVPPIHTLYMIMRIVELERQVSIMS